MSDLSRIPRVTPADEVGRLLEGLVVLRGHSPELTAPPPRCHRVGSNVRTATEPAGSLRPGETLIESTTCAQGPVQLDKDALLFDIQRALQQQLLRHGLQPSDCLKMPSEDDDKGPIVVSWRFKVLAAIAGIALSACVVHLTWDLQLAGPPY